MSQIQKHKVQKAESVGTFCMVQPYVDSRRLKYDKIDPFSPFEGKNLPLGRREGKLLGLRGTALPVPFHATALFSSLASLPESQVQSKLI